MCAVRKSGISAEQILVGTMIRAYTCMTAGYTREDYIKLS